VICPRNARESLAHALPPTARRHHEPIDPAFAAVLRPEDRPHEPAVLLSCEEDRARPRELPRDPLASVTTVRAVREPALLPEAHEGVVVRRSSKAGPVLPCSSVCHDAKLTLREVAATSRPGEGRPAVRPGQAPQGNAGTQGMRGHITHLESGDALPISATTRALCSFGPTIGVASPDHTPKTASAASREERARPTSRSSFRPSSRPSFRPSS